MAPDPDPAVIGLSSAVARERLAALGPNELPRQRPRRLIHIARDVIAEPMLAMLLVAGLAYLLLGVTAEAIVLLLFAGVSIILTIVQENRTEGVIEAMRDLAAPRALVLRDGEALRIPGSDVVPGDVLVLDQGDRVAADARLLEATSLECDESLLTGESLPVPKSAGIPGGIGDTVFAATLVTRGSGLAQVTATGARTAVGKIGRSLAELESEAPRLQRETARLVRIAATAGLGVAALVFLLYGLLRGGWIAALLAGIATAMSLLPEEFPVVLTIFLAMGSWRIAKAGVLTRRAAAIEALGAATVLCTDKTGTLTMNRMVATTLWRPGDDLAATTTTGWHPRFHDLLRHGALASAPVPSDPMEIAFHEAALQTGAGQNEDLDLVHTHGLHPDLLAMSNVWQAGDGTLRSAAKGAPEAIARLCRLDGAAHERLDEAAQAMAASGMRVLGVAAARVAPENATSPHSDHAFELLGLVGLSDPLRPGVREAIAECRAAGVRVVMITGDYPATARAIAAEAGLAAGDLLTGTDIAALDNAALASRIGTVAVCARTMPDQKLRIIEALKCRGDVVAMTGDGVNDAPALKAAHIGIAMGRRGTDVAREAAAIVLVEDDFGAIVTAIRLGRRIYDNIRKASGFILAVHVPIAGLALLPVAFGLPIILGPLQIALLELIIDPVCALVYEAGDDERDVMRRPPRPPAARLFSAQMVIRALAQGALALVLLAAMLLWAAQAGLPATELRTLLFVSLVGAVVAIVLANLSFRSALSWRRVSGNRALHAIVAGCTAAVAAILWSGTVQHWLGMAPLPPGETVLALAMGPIILACLTTATALHTARRQWA